MGRKRLSSKQTRKSIERFVFEARECARQEFGFAAMSTIFPVVLAVSEAVSSEHSDEDLLRSFVSHMSDKTSWLVAPVANLSDGDIAKKLAQVRNGLAHQLSLPVDVYLTNTSADAQKASKKYPHRYFVSTAEFVDAVDRTVSSIIETYPDAILDSHPRGETQRSSATRLEEWLEVVSKSS